MTASVLPAPTAPPASAAGAGAASPWPRRAAVAVVGVCGASVVLGLVLLVLNLGTELPEGTDWRVANIGAVAFFGCAALIALRRPANAFSWAALAAGASQILGYGAGEWAIYTLLTDPGALPGGAWAQWFSLTVWMPGYLLIPTVLVLLFPDGRPPSPRWRPVVWGSLAVIVAAAVPWALTPWEDLGEPVVAPDVANPIAVSDLPDALSLLPMLILPCVALAIASVVVRVRRADGVERQQLRWAGAGVGVALLLALSGYVSLDVAPFTIGFALAVLPGAVAVAVLRHGLWELGPVARRSVVLALLSAAVLAVYGLAALLLGGGEVIATAIVAVGLLPLHARLERLVNRLLYGDRDEPWAAVRRLGERLATPTTPEEVAREVGRALRLPLVEVRAPGEAADAREGTLALPLVFHGELVGTLVAGGREVGAADWRALEDLAPQLAASVHAARLADDLRRSRERIVTAREEERRRLRADLHDEVGPSLAVLALRLDAAAATSDDPETLRELAGQSRDALAQVRRIVHDLRPAALADLGLAAALDAAVRQVDGAGMRARLDVPRELGDLPAAVEVAAYRIAREALSNVVRHARAQACTVMLERTPRELVVTVTDDGRGISETAPRGVGLGSMAERADELGGSLGVRPLHEEHMKGSDPLVGAGTVVEARLPL